MAGILVSGGHNRLPNRHTNVHLDEPSPLGQALTAVQHALGFDVEDEALEGGAPISRRNSYAGPEAVANLSALSSMGTNHSSLAESFLLFLSNLHFGGKGNRGDYFLVYGVRHLVLAGQLDDAIVIFTSHLDLIRARAEKQFLYFYVEDAGAIEAAVQALSPAERPSTDAVWRMKRFINARRSLLHRQPDLVFQLAAQVTPKLRHPASAGAGVGAAAAGGVGAAGAAGAAAAARAEERE
mmetsp:Transcript_65642/g.207660  ORF Transcript_65642/g.207660 Transcript_65642/m.207660 type:complete len:239 (-) Transcript_65642:194-910(-)